MTKKQKRIEELTKEQSELLKAWRSEWFKIGSSTEPADRSAAEAAVTEIYKILGKPQPKFIWAGSPAQAVRTAAIMTEEVQENISRTIDGGLRNFIDTCIEVGTVNNEIRKKLAQDLRGYLYHEFMEAGNNWKDRLDLYSFFLNNNPQTSVQVTQELHAKKSELKINLAYRKKRNTRTDTFPVYRELRSKLSRIFSTLVVAESEALVATSDTTSEEILRAAGLSRGSILISEALRDISVGALFSSKVFATADSQESFTSGLSALKDSLEFKKMDSLSEWNSKDDAIREQVGKKAFGQALPDEVEAHASPATISASILGELDKKGWELVKNLQDEVKEMLKEYEGFADSLKIIDARGEPEKIFEALNDMCTAAVEAAGTTLEKVAKHINAGIHNVVHQSRFYGQHESYWIAFYCFCQEVLGVEYEEESAHLLKLWETLARSTGWWWAYDNICIMTERQSKISWSDDPVPVLHCEDGPAIAYPDGWEIYSWRGTTVPKNWITNPETLTAADALAEQNAELRRSACEILGWDKILVELKAEVIDEDANPQVGLLLRADLPEAPGSKFLKVECGTGRTFVIPVPENMMLAIEANAWTYGLTIDEYKQLEVRT